jgi:hypothetical protein
VLELAAQCEDIRFTLKQLVSTSKLPEEQAVLKQMQDHAAGLCKGASQLQTMHRKRT